MAKQRVKHILWKSLACVLRLLLQNLNYFEMREPHFRCFWCLKYYFLTCYFFLFYPIFPENHQVSIVKIQKWGSIANSRTVPHQFHPWGTLRDLGGIRDGHKTWGTVRELDIEPHFWIFTMLTWQKPGKWGKTAKSRIIKKPFLSPRNPQNGVPSW